MDVPYRNELRTLFPPVLEGLVREVRSILSVRAVMRMISKFEDTTEWHSADEFYQRFISRFLDDLLARDLSFEEASRLTGFLVGRIEDEELVSAFEDDQLLNPDETYEFADIALFGTEAERHLFEFLDKLDVYILFLGRVEPEMAKCLVASKLAERYAEQAQ